MSRPLDTVTLDALARHLAGEFMGPDRKSPSGKVFVGGPSYVVQDLHKITFKDEHEYLLEGVQSWLGKRALVEFESRWGEVVEPREDEVFETLLREKLAIDTEGNHIDGVVGTSNLGSRIVGQYSKVVKLTNGERTVVKNHYWPVYAGEGEERVRLGEDILDGVDIEHDGVIRKMDIIPPEAKPLPAGANVTNISAEAALLGLDAIGNQVDEGSTAAEIRGRSGAQPADPDAAETGTLLFTLPMSDPAMQAAVDDTDGTVSKTANAITSDTNADNTGTLGYCRVAATGTGADDHVDGNAGTVDEAFIFNTTAISAGATVSMSSLRLDLSQGSTAS